MPAKFKYYDIKENAANEKFLKELFEMPPVVLPMQNLGEMAFIMQRHREAFSLLDMSLKLHKILDSSGLG